MNYSYLLPNWFFGFSIGMELLFGIVTLLVAMFAFRIFSVTKERKTRLFGTSFLLIGLSYIIWAGINFWFSYIDPEGLREITIEGLALIGVTSLYAYMILFISGLVTLAYIACDVKKGKVYYMLMGLSLLVIAASFYKLISFRILSVFLIAVIAYHYLEEYLNNKNRKTFLVLLAFILLFLSSLVFAFSSAYYMAYVIGHILELAAYMLILINLIKSVKK